MPKRRGTATGSSDLSPELVLVDPALREEPPAQPASGRETERLSSASLPELVWAKTPTQRRWIGDRGLLATTALVVLALVLIGSGERQAPGREVDGLVAAPRIPPIEGSERELPSPAPSSSGARGKKSAGKPQVKRPKSPPSRPTTPRRPRVLPIAGGGYVFGASHFQVGPASAALVDFTIASACRTPVTIPAVPVRLTGSFAFHRSTRTAAGRAVSVRVEGRFVTPERAGGTIRVTGPGCDGRRVRFSATLS